MAVEFPDALRCTFKLTRTVPASGKAELRLVLVFIARKDVQADDTHTAAFWIAADVQ